MKIKFHWLLVPVFFVVLPSSVLARELVAYLPDLMNDHHLVRAAEAGRDEARFRQDAAVGGWYPSLDLSADGGREWVTRVDESEIEENTNFASLRLSQLVTDFGATSGRVKLADATFERSKVDIEAARQNILLQGIFAYLGVIKAREKLAYAGKSEENISKQTGMEETLVQRGAGLSSDILQTKSQLARARALRVSVEGELAEALNRFRAVFGFTPTDDEIKSFRLPADPAGSLPTSLEAAAARAMENNPSILAAEQNNKVLKYDVSVQSSRYYPRLSLVAEQIRRENDLGVHGVRLEGFVGAELTYNLFRGGGDRNSVKAAEKNLVSAESILANTRMQVEERVRNAWQILLISREKYKYLKNQAAIVGEFLELARKERKLGSRSLLDVLTGEVEAINAQSQAVAAEVETVQAVFQLFFTMGDLNMDLVKAQ